MTDDPDPAKTPPAGEDLLTAYRWMLLARRLEEKIASIYRSGGIAGGVYTGKGQEALSCATGMCLRKGDVFAPLIRDQAGRLAWGEDPMDVTRTYLGAATGPMRGRDGNVHRGRPAEGMPAMISHLGAMIPVVAGMLYARRLKGEETGIGVTSIGDGGTSTGAFHEGLNLACVERLPLVLVVANNQWAYSTPNASQFACGDLADRAVGYGATPHRCKGNDITDCLATLRAAAASARGGGGPQLVVASFLRLSGHGEHDDAAYITQAMRGAEPGRDCLEVALEQLRAKGLLDEEALGEMEKEVTARVVAAAATAQRDPTPNPYREDWSALSTLSG